MNLLNAIRPVVSHFVIISSLVLFSIAVKAQSKKVDSLIVVLKTAKNDTSKVNTLNLLSKWQGWIVGNNDTARYYALQAKSLAEKLKHSRGLASALNNIGIAYDNTGNYPLALKYYKEALGIHKQMKNRKGISSSYNNIGIVYNNQGNYPEALKYYYLCLRIEEELGDSSSAAISYFNIAIIYTYQHKYDEALEHYSSSLKFFQKLNDKVSLAAIHNSIGLLYESIGKADLALENHLASKKLSEEIGDINGISASLNHIGMNHHNQGRFHEALEYYFEALKLRENSSDVKGQAGTCGNIGNSYFALGEFKKGRIWQEKSLRIALKHGIKEYIGKSYQLISRTDSALGNYKEAYHNYKLYVIYNDSLLSEENERKSYLAKMQYEFDKRASADSVANAKQGEIKNAQIAKQKAELYARRNQQYYLIGGLALILVFALFMYNRFKVTSRQKTEIEKQKLLVDLKQKEVLDSIEYASRIQRAIMTSENYIKRQLEKLKRN